MTISDPVAAEKPPIRGLALIAAPLLGVILFVVVGIAVIAAYLAAHGELTRIGLENEIVIWRRSFFLQISVGILFYLAFLASAWICLPKRGPASLTSYFPPISWSMAATAILAAFAAAGIIGAGMNYLETHHFIDFHVTPGEEMLMTNDPAKLAVIFVLAAIVGPLVEEIYFRGMLLRWLRKRLNLTISTLINAAFFALLHGRFLTHPGLEGLAVTSALMVPGVILVLIAVRANSLRASFLTHATYNGMLLLAAAAALSAK